MSFIFFQGAASLAAAEVKIPILSSPVIDDVNLLTTAEKNQLVNFMQNLNSQTEVQFQVWILNSLEGEPIENLSIRAFDAWKLGQKGSDKGLLFVLAVNDRKMRLEVGRGLEGDIPDAIASRLIREVASPYFKKQDFYGGIQLTFQAALQPILKDPAVQEKLNQLKNRKSKKNAMGSIEKFFPLLIFIFFILSSLSRVLGLGGRRAGRFGGGGFYSGGSSGWGGGWSSGGGGWSGGGGGSAGGGASGDW